MLIASLLFVSGIAAAGMCEPELLPAPVLKLVKPLVELRTQQANGTFTEEGRWIAESPVTPEIERRFEEMLSNQSLEGDQALAYLLGVYLGEASGEILVCEVTNRGRRMLPLIEAFERCQPLTGLEPLHKYVKGSSVLPGMARDGIESGKECSHAE